MRIQTDDGNGRALTETDQYGTTTHEYGDGPEPIRSTDPDGTVWEMVYDARNELVSMTEDGEPFGTFRQDLLGRDQYQDVGDGLTATYGYSGDDELWTRVQTSTGTTERLVSGGGRLLGWRQDGVQQVALTNDALGRLRREVDDAGRATEYAYDDAGRLTRRTDETRGGSTTYVYDGAGRVTSTTDLEGNDVTHTYWPDGTVRTTTDARGQTWSFDRTPTTATLTDPLGHATTTTTNAYGLPTLATYADGTTTSVSYEAQTVLEDGDELVSSRTDELGRTRTFTYDGDGRVETASDLSGVTWTYAYPEEMVETITSPEGRGWRIERSEQFETTRAVYPDGAEITMTYDGRGNPDVQTLATGDTIDLDHDGEDRITSRTTSTGESETRTYDDNGRLQSITNGAGTVTYDYDTVGRLFRLTGVDGSSVEYEYDRLDRVTFVHTRATAGAAPETTAYVYDGNGNVVQVTDPLGGTTTFTYDAASRMETRTLPNGVQTSWTYDVRNRVESVTHRDGGGAVLASERYARRATGEPERITREDGSYVQLGYDAAGRLTSERYHDSAGTLTGEHTYAYDADGNRIQKDADTYTYGAGFRLASAGSDSFGYDAAGRVTSLTRGGTTTLSYDTADHVTAVTQGGATTSYQCDGAGRRVAVDDAGANRRYLVAPAAGSPYESPHLVTDGAGAQQQAYVYAGEHALMRYGPSGPTYYLRDAMGSVIALADSAGARTARFEYDAFGNERSSSGSAIGLPPSTAGDFRFHGMWRDPTGLYHVRARTYDPVVGRFTSKDPAEGRVERVETWNPYVFADNSPAVYRDPLGLYSMADIQASFLSRQALRNAARRAIRQTVKEEVKDRTLGALSESLMRSLARLIPGLGEAASLVPLPDTVMSPMQQGMAFEALIQTSICGWMPGGTFKEYTYSQVPISGRGLTQGDGFNCADFVDARPVSGLADIVGDGRSVVVGI